MEFTKEEILKGMSDKLNETEGLTMEEKFKYAGFVHSLVLQLIHNRDKLDSARSQEQMRRYAMGLPKQREITDEEKIKVISGEGDEHLQWLLENEGSALHPDDLSRVVKTLIKKVNQIVIKIEGNSDAD